MADKDDIATGDEPRSNTRALDAGLVKKIEELQNHTREGNLQLCALAYEIYAQHSTDGKTYDVAFIKWWKGFDLVLKFGKQSNFTKKAKAGEALDKAKLHGYYDKMPSAVNALYECAMLTQDEMKLCVEGRYKRQTVGGTPERINSKIPVVYPDASAAEIKNWRLRWREPEKYAAQTTAPELNRDALVRVETAVTKAIRDIRDQRVGVEIMDVLNRAHKRLARAEGEESKKKPS